MLVLRLLILPASLCILANYNQSEDWWILSKGDAEGNVYLIDGVAKFDNDAVRSYNAHFFYQSEVNGVKSAQVEYYVYCGTSRLKEARYIDFDAGRVPIYSGDNYELNDFDAPKAGTIGEEIVRFACSDDNDRSNKYTKIQSDVDKWALGELLLEEAREQKPSGGLS